MMNHLKEDLLQKIKQLVTKMCSLFIRLISLYIEYRLFAQGDGAMIVQYRVAEGISLPQRAQMYVELKLQYRIFLLSNKQFGGYVWTVCCPLQHVHILSLISTTDYIANYLLVPTPNLYFCAALMLFHVYKRLIGMSVPHLTSFFIVS